MPVDVEPLDNLYVQPDHSRDKVDPKPTSHEFNDFSGECVEQLVRAYNGEQSTVEPTNIVDQNTNIVKDNELSMEYKNISNELE